MYRLEAREIGDSSGRKTRINTKMEKETGSVHKRNNDRDRHKHAQTNSYVTEKMTDRETR